MNRLGIDIGGTKIEAIVLDSNNNILIRTRVPTERDNGYEHILNQLSKLHYKIKKYLVNKFHFGVSVPGPLNENGDKLKKSNTVVMINIHQKHKQEKKINIYKKRVYQIP